MNCFNTIANRSTLLQPPLIPATCLLWLHFSFNLSFSYLADLHLDLEQMADIASIMCASRSCTDTDLTLCIVFQREHLY